MWIRVTSQSCVSGCDVEKTLLICRTSRSKMSGPLNLKKVPAAHLFPPKTTHFDPPLAHFVCHHRAAYGRNHSAETGGPVTSEKDAFCDVHFFQWQKQILTTSRVKQHAFWGRSLFYRIYVPSKLSFSNPKREDQTEKKASTFGSRVEMPNPQTSARGQLRPYYSRQNNYTT